MHNELLLLSGMDIPFPQARVSIHQPRLKEIALIGEYTFNVGLQFLHFDISSLSDEDKKDLDGKTNFDIIISEIQKKEYSEYKRNILYVIALLFPDYQIRFTPTALLLIKDGQEFSIDNSNYDIFIDIINSMFLLNDVEGGGPEKYNPADKAAERIAEKLKKRHQKQAEQRQEEGPKEIKLYSRYVSILAVGECKDLNELMNYTVFQLLDEMKRFNKKQDWDSYIQWRIAGAQNLEEVDNWMIDIHP